LNNNNMISIRTQYIIHKFVLLALSALCIVMFYIEASGPTVVDTVSMKLVYASGWIGIVSYIGIFLKRNFDAFLTSLYQIFYFMGVLIGSTLASFGERMYEIKMFGTGNGVFWFLVLSLLITSEAIQQGYKLFNPGTHRSFSILPPYWGNMVVKYTVLFIIICSLFVLLIYGSPVLLGISRTNYWGSAAPSFLSFLRILIILTFFWVSALSLNASGGITSSRIGKIYAALYVFLGLFLLGEKFSLFIMYMSSWLFVYAAKTNRTYPIKTVTGIISVIIIMAAQVTYRYEVAGLGVMFIFSRFTLQAQLPWSTFNEAAGILYFGLGSVGEYINIFHLREIISDRYLPLNVQAAHEISGTSLSGFLPSWQILTFGIPISIIFLIIFGIFLGYLQATIVHYVRLKNIITAFFVFSFHFFLLSVWYVGNFNVINIIILLSFLFIIAYLSPRKLERGVPTNVHR